MGHSYAATFFHCVFSTHRRSPVIEEPTKLWSYLAGIAHNLKIDVVAIGGTKDHVHLLIAPPTTIPIAEAVQKLKSNSSRWLREKTGWSGWQQGYGVFTVSPPAVEAVKRYIADQERHHSRRDSREEFIAMLRQAGLPVADDTE